MDRNGNATTFYGSIPKEQRRKLFGLETPDQIEWRGWEPGNEYVKQLVIKNFDMNAVKFKYKQPGNKAFSMEFPEWIKLRAGMSCSIKVLFRPLKLQPYSDNIEIFINQSSFLIPVNAYTPATKIEVSPSVDFGFVPVKEKQTLPLSVCNTGEVEVDVAWRVEAPFSIVPAAFSLAPGQSLSCSASYEPSEASSCSVTAACILSNGSIAYCQIRGIAKFPYLSLEQTTVDFGEVVVGSKVHRTIRFGNHSPVPANFSLVPAASSAAFSTSSATRAISPPLSASASASVLNLSTNGALSSGINNGPASLSSLGALSSDGVFDIHPTYGTLGPDEYSEIKVSYTPLQNGMFSSEHFTLSTPGGNKLNLNLRGFASEPRVSLSAQCINFGSAPVNSSVSRVLYLQNHSDIPVMYDCQAEMYDIFSISRPRGVLAAGSMSPLSITYTPPLASTFWKRLVILMKDAEPLSVDLLGTAYDERNHPPSLQARHIVSYMERIERGEKAVEEAQLLSKPASPAVAGMSDGGGGRGGGGGGS
eukprot:CAMPEP_0175076276 /NCGR_PEP_ID=MMETSP0052_2-20121109/22612_1 /TAXON_ID=51329 ORGANISM="Polytomella parva, Strain SAG 63-3" /NCGR_SAMPLE_ID=MMETSP0052_2 /ASSEMBLY_ACC=CAM_ASM_000194 /LENGTH=531 /DNA_ID=CAMNT_0016345347 /DNA_START=36 /DNA_END=1628 /DNA_ORIENTATION=-